MIRLAFYKAQDHLFDRLVSWWTKGPYSHVEIIVDAVGDGYYACLSSSFRDGGVRIKNMPLPADRWDIVEVRLPVDEEKALLWYRNYHGAKYDVLGLFGFVFRRGIEDDHKWFCSEVAADILSFAEPWRYDPNALHATLTRYV